MSHSSGGWEVHDQDADWVGSWWGTSSWLVREHILTLSPRFGEGDLISLIFYAYLFFFFWPCCVVYSILIPWPEMEPVPLAQGSNPHPLKWKHRVLTTGLPGKSSSSLFKKCWSSHSVRTFSYHMSNCHFWIYDWGSYDMFSAQRVLPPLQNFIGAKCFWNLDFWFGNWERAAWLICLIH